MPNPGLDNLTPEPRYGSLISSGDIELQADIAALEAADVSLDARLDAAEAQLATLPSIRPRCRVSHSVNQTVGAGARVALAFDTEIYDTDGIHSTSVNTSRLTCVTAGLYTIKGHATITMGAGGGQVNLEIRLGGATFLEIVFGVIAGTVSEGWDVATDYPLAAGDYVELCINNGSANTITITATSPWRPAFMMRQAGL